MEEVEVVFFPGFLLLPLQEVEWKQHTHCAATVNVQQQEAVSD